MDKEIYNFPKFKRFLVYTWVLPLVIKPLYLLHSHSQDDHTVRFSGCSSVIPKKNVFLSHLWLRHNKILHLIKYLTWVISVFIYTLINRAYTLSKFIASSLKCKFTATPVTSTFLRGMDKCGWRDLLTSQALPYLRHFIQNLGSQLCLFALSSVILSFVLPTPLYLHRTQLRLHREYGLLSDM